MSTTITGAEIQRRDVIKSAAMPQPERVESINISSTGRTVEVLTERHFYRIGCSSKVRLIERATTPAL